MRNLADLGRWMIETPALKSEWGAEWWKIAFEACGSPSDWENFQRTYKDDPKAIRLLGEFQRIDDQNQLLPRSRIRSPVELPDFDIER